MPRLAVISALIALAAAGAAGAALTPPQYRAKATAICKTTSAKLDALPEPKTKNDIPPLFKKAIVVFRAQYASLRHLLPPKTLRTLHVKVLSLEKQQIDGLQKFLDQVDDGADIEKSYNALDAKLSKVSDGETAAWKRLGVPACANL